MSWTEPMPLSSIAEVIRGVTFSKKDVKPSPGEGLAPVLRAGNIQGELILQEDLVFVSEKRISQKQKLRAGDIVMCTSSGSADVVGKTAFLERDWDGSFGAFCAAIRARDSECVPRYLFHFLQTPDFRSWTSNSSGINIKNIRKSELDNVLIPLPSIDEQRRIAAILDLADSVRRKRESALTLANDLLKSAFLEMFGDPVSNPRGWPVVALEDLGEVQGGLQVSKKRDTLALRRPYLRVANVYRDRLNLSEVKEIGLTQGEFLRAKLETGDVLIVEGHGNPEEIGRSSVSAGGTTSPRQEVLDEPRTARAESMCQVFEATAALSSGSTFQGSSASRSAAVMAKGSRS